MGILDFIKGAPDILLARCTQEFVGAEPRETPGVVWKAVHADGRRVISGSIAEVSGRGRGECGNSRGLRGTAVLIIQIEKFRGRLRRNRRRSRTESPSIVRALSIPSLSR